MRMLNEFERGFVSAFIDTDGYIFLNKPHHSRRTYSPAVRVGFSNNSLELLKKVQQMLGINQKITKKKGTNNYKFDLSQSNSEALLVQINLIVKEEKRRIALELIGFKKSRYGKLLNNSVNELYRKQIDTFVDSFHTL